MTVTADQLRVISPAPQRVRLSFLCNKTQVDVALPLDVPVVGLVPQLVKLAEIHDAGQTDSSDDPSAAEAKNSVWVLSRQGATTPLTPETTLREAGVAEGELLRLIPERALSAPTLYDDVVDAAARLNKAGHPSWDAAAARWMAFIGVYLASGAWVYFLVANVFEPGRPALVVLSVAVGLTLAGAGALAYRRYKRRDIGAALGWAVLPISAAVAWVALHGLGGYGLAAGCAAMVLVSAALFRGVGTGHWGYLAVQVISVLSGIALVAHSAGVRADLVGAALALIGTLGCLIVPRLTVRFARIKPLLRALERAAESKSNDTPTPPGAQGVWARVQSETMTRSALYTGLGVSAGLGALVVLIASGPVRWSGLAFALGCAAALGLHTQWPVTVLERTALAVPAAALTVLSCVLAQGGGQPIPITAFGGLLATTLVFALIGAKARPGRRSDRMTTLLAYLNYLAVTALIPLALWATGAYGPEGLL